MGNFVKRLVAEPIIVVTLETSHQSGQSSALLVDALIRDGETGIFVIYDMRTLNLSFGQVISMLADHSQQKPGTVTDPRIHPIDVGASELVKFSNRAFQEAKHGKLHIPLFQNLPDALAYARQEIKLRNDPSPSSTVL